MSDLIRNDWQAEGVPAPNREQAAGNMPLRGEKWVALRDTLIVFSMQLSFRVTMFLRHLNY